MSEVEGLALYRAKEAMSEKAPDSYIRLPKGIKFIKITERLFF